ncbi:MAG: hypothetical protein N3A61_09920 [Ignavibacteria bacterium]|nr:hypothetical protein [Ignavibacteria bacterium]
MTVTIFSILIVIVYLLRTDLITLEHQNFNLPYDRHKYIEMAETNLNFHIAPFCWRILTPMLSSILPFDIQTNFLLVSVAFIIATAVGVYYLVKHIFKEKIYAWLGVLIFYSFGWIVKNSLSDFWLVDSSLFFFLALAIFFVYKDNNLAFSIAVLLGALAKEMIFYLLPFYLMHNLNLYGIKSALKRTTIVFLPATIIFIIITQIIPSRNDDVAYLNTLSQNLTTVTVYGSAFDLNLFLENFNHKFDIIFIVRNILGTYGIFVIIFSLYSLFYVKQDRLIYLIMILLSWIPLLFSFVNLQRLMIISFPFFIVLTLRGIDILSTRFKLPFLLAFVFPLTLIFTNLYYYDRVFTSLWVQTIFVIINFVLIFISGYILQSKSRLVK